MPTNSYASAAGMCVADFNAGIAAYITRTIQPGSNIYWNTNVTAASLTTGQLLPWKVVITDDTTYASQNCLADHGKVAFLGQRGYFYAYDLATGQLAWKSETMDYPWASNSFGAYNIETAYGMLFRQAYDGVYAFNWTNGKIVWHYKAPTLANFETPYIDNGTEVYSFNGAAEIADGKMYVYNTEHTPTWPLTRGWGLHCINITTGEGIWKINNPMQQGAIADGYLVAPNPWDGSLYVFGKGLSATTVSVPQTQITAGQKVVISGTVLDQSPAQEGKPCVSASSMATQMEYLHLQMPIGGLWGNETLTGVPVSLDAIDPNGNSVHIATVTSEGYSGTYAYTWTPQNTRRIPDYSHIQRRRLIRKLIRNSIRNSSPSSFNHSHTNPSNKPGLSRKRILPCLDRCNDSNNYRYGSRSSSIAKEKGINNSLSLFFY